MAKILRFLPSVNAGELLDITHGLLDRGKQLQSHESISGQSGIQMASLHMQLSRKIATLHGRLLPIDPVNGDFDLAELQEVVANILPESIKVYTQLQTDFDPIYDIAIDADHNIALKLSENLLMQQDYVWKEY